MRQKTVGGTKGILHFWPDKKTYSYLSNTWDDRPGPRLLSCKKELASTVVRGPSAILGDPTLNTLSSKQEQPRR